MLPPKEPKIGLVLGSGGPKGFIHIGILKVLDREGIPIDHIAGSSIGALIGGLYAGTKDIALLEKLALDTNWRELLSLADPRFRGGFLAGEKLRGFTQAVLEQKEVGSPKIPFAAVSTDLVTGEAVVYQDEDLPLAIRASASVPLLFRPLKHGNRILTDGALSMPVPVAVARDMGSEFVIAVNLDDDYFGIERTAVGYSELSGDVLRLFAMHLAKENVRDADFVISPKVGKLGWNVALTRSKTAQVIKLGEETMEALLPALKDAIRKKQRTFGQRMREFLVGPKKK